MQYIVNGTMRIHLPKLYNGWGFNTCTKYKIINVHIVIDCVVNKPRVV